MQMQKSLIVGMVIASLWAATGAVYPVWSQDWGRGAGRGAPLLRLLHKVGLTDAQKDQIKQILADHRQTLRSLRSQLRANREALVDTLLKPEPLQGTNLEPFIQEAHRLRDQLAREWLQVMLKVHDVLTPEQLTQASQLKDQLRALRHEMRSLLGNPE
jgi:Spy/CpxP family protein refolding chaperone